MNCMDVAKAIYGFLSTHTAVTGYVLVAGAHALPTPGEGFKFYKFIYNWIMGLLPYNKKPDQSSQSKDNKGVTL